MSVLNSILHFLQYNYIPTKGPWYEGAVWANIFVGPIAFLLGWLIGKTKFNPFRRLRNHIDKRHNENRKIQDEHNEWMARHIAKQHHHLTGEHADVHPHFPHIGKQKDSS